MGVEIRAMLVVKEHYEKQNWKVNDLSKKKGLGYDYVIKNKKGNIKMIEVKGLQKKSRVNLTINEVKFAKNTTDISVLAIVHDIKLEKRVGKWIGKKGVLKIIDPINLDESKLFPTQYSYDWITDSSSKN